MEILIEELLTLHATSSTFRHIFESHQTTQLFIDTYKAMVAKLSSSSSINGWNIRILEKLTHFGLALALDNTVGGGQKREVGFASFCLCCQPGPLIYYIICRFWIRFNPQKSSSTLQRRQQESMQALSWTTALCASASHQRDLACKSAREQSSRPSPE